MLIIEHLALFIRQYYNPSMCVFIYLCLIYLIMDSEILEENLLIIVINLKNNFNKLTRRRLCLKMINIHLLCRMELLS